MCQTACGPPEEAPEPTVPEATTAPVDPEPVPDGDGPRGLGLTTPNAAPGYVFFNPLLSHTTYLVDVEGQVVHTWESQYDSGGEDDRRLFGQHDVRWVGEGTPGSGRLTLFNNRIPSPEGDHSAVFELAPPTDDAGRYGPVLPDGDAFGPQEPSWSYMAPDKGVIPQFLHFLGAPPPERPYVHHRGCNGAIFRGDT